MILFYMNQKWRKTQLHSELSKIDKIRCIFEEDLQIDFKFNSMGLFVISKPNSEKTLLEIKQSAKDFKLTLANIQNQNTNLKIQVFVDFSNKSFFNTIQDYAFELEIQIIPFEEEKDITQYIERLVVSEFTDDKNPFQKDPTVSSKSHELTILNTLKMIPKVGEKNAKTILENFKNIKAISNASVEELSTLIGDNIANAVWNFFNGSKK